MEEPIHMIMDWFAASPDIAAKLMSYLPSEQDQLLSVLKSSHSVLEFVLSLDPQSADPELQSVIELCLRGWLEQVGRAPLQKNAAMLPAVPMVEAVAHSNDALQLRKKPVDMRERPAA